MCESAMYSASAELSATDGCSLLPKAIRHLFSQISHPVRERLDPFHVAQSESHLAFNNHAAVIDLKVEVKCRP